MTAKYLFSISLAKISLLTTVKGCSMVRFTLSQEVFCYVTENSKPCDLLVSRGHDLAITWRLSPITRLAHISPVLD